MDGRRLGAALRVVRLRCGWPQREVARRAGVTQSTYSRIERGHTEHLSLGCIDRVAGALDVRVDLLPRWRGGDLARLLDARHAALVEQVMARFAQLAGWAAVPEVSFAIYGERGSIDVFAWHAASRTVLIVEVKTEIVDVQDLVGTADRKGRLARTIARERGWDPLHVGVWIAVADTRTNHRRVADHRATLRSAFPGDGFALARWLREPAGPFAGLSFLPAMHGRTQRQRIATRGAPTRPGTDGR